MANLGWVMPQIISALANAPPGPPIYFSKLNINDGFWRMVVSEENAYNFGFILPPIPNDPKPGTHIVITMLLPMGWTLSPANFCVTSKTSRDIAPTLTLQTKGSLAPHPLKH